MTQDSWDLRFLDAHDPVLRKKFKEAEDLAAVYPDSSITALRMFIELLLEQIAKQHQVAGRGKDGNPKESSFEFINRLTQRKCIPAPQAQYFHFVRTAGNRAAHGQALAGSQLAIEVLERARSLAFWFGERSWKLPPELPPDRRVAVTVFAERKKGWLGTREYSLLVTKVGRHWALPNTTLRDENVYSAAQDLIVGSLGVLPTLLKPIANHTYAHPDLVHLPDEGQCEAEIMEAPQARFILLYVSSETGPYLNDVERLVIARGGKVRLISTSHAEAERLMPGVSYKDPTIVLFRGGKLLASLTGLRPISEVDVFLCRHGLDEYVSISGRVRVSYIFACVPFVALSLAKQRHDTFLQWCPLPELLQLPIETNHLRAITVGTEMYLNLIKGKES